MPLLFTASAPCGPARSYRSAYPSPGATSRIWFMWATLPGWTARSCRPWILSLLEVPARGFLWLACAGASRMSEAAFLWRPYELLMK